MDSPKQHGTGIATLDAFIADLDIRATAEVPRMRESLCVVSRSTGEAEARVCLDVDRGFFLGRHLLELYGIEDEARGASREWFAASCLGFLFEITQGRPMTGAERLAVGPAFLAVAQASPEVAAFAARLDRESMAAFGSDAWGDSYAWIAGPSPDAAAMKRFVLRHPLLAGVAANGNLLFDAATGESVDEAYGNLLAAVADIGFPLGVGRDGEVMGGVPLELVSRFEQMQRPALFAAFGKDELREVEILVRLARRLPADTWPSSTDGWMALCRSAQTLHKLEDRLNGGRDIEGALSDGYECAIDFADEELGAAFDPEKSGEEEMRWTLRVDPLDLARDIAHHGVRLAGHGAWLDDGYDADSDLFPDDLDAIDFSELKAAMARDGFVRTAMAAAAREACCAR